MDNNTLFEKSLQLLELPAVLELLAQQAASEGAKVRASALRPAADAYEIRRRLAETGAAKNMMAARGDPSFTGLKDVGAALARAELGGMLNTRELLDIAGVLRCARTVKQYGDGEGQSCIDHLFRALETKRYLEEKITNAILGEEEIADTASPELADIRRHIRGANARIREALQRIISSPSYAKALQDPIITMRSDRYVIPVKAEYKSAVPGLVHDISSSGATLFIEPMQSVQANNEVRELAAKEKKEIERILMELSAEAAAQKADIGLDVDLLTSLDLIFAKAKLSYAQKAAEPLIQPQGGVCLRRARHPLLPKDTAVPIDLVLGEGYDSLIITGPNTGGKTVSLKTLGLLCAMAQCGLHIPAEDGSSVPVFSLILADIGDEQSIEQSLSTFSSHMVNIVSILQAVDSGARCLLLFDELGAGTDPAEGAALAISIIEYVRARGAMVAATTHYAELKVYATSQAGVQNASCEFDVETLRPTYRLIIGIPGKSNAFAISRRLGVPERIIADAAGRLDPESRGFEEVIARLDAQRQQLEQESQEMNKALRAAQEDRKKAHDLLAESRVRHEKAAEKARRDAERILSEARESADQVFEELKELRKAGAREADWQQANAAKAALRRKLNETAERLHVAEEAPELPPPSARPVRAGDLVLIPSMGVEAEVLTAKDGVLSLRAGILNVTAKESEVRLIEEKKTKSPQKTVEHAQRVLQTMAVPPEIDLRGMMTDEGVMVMERYLDSAYLAKLNTVTVIHGKGTGALRAAVQAALKKRPDVKSFRKGRYGEGEDGVTIVEFRQ